MNAAKVSAEGTHNHPEGIKGAQATAMCIFLARKGASKDEIQQCMEQEFGYRFPLTIAELQKRYSWNGVDREGNGGICQDSVPQAIQCALQATDFEDAVRNAISIGGDSDTIGCITGSIAEALYGVPANMCEKAMTYLPRTSRNWLLSLKRNTEVDCVKQKEDDFPGKIHLGGQYAFPRWREGTFFEGAQQEMAPQ